MHWRKVSRMDNPAAYARRVLVNAHVSHRRLRRNRELPSDLVDAADQAAPVEDHALRLTLLDGLARLDIVDRTVLVLRYWEDLDVATTAGLLGISAANVRTRSSRALHPSAPGARERREGSQPMDDEQQVMLAMRSAADAVRPPVDDLVRGATELGQRRRRARRARLAGGLAIGVVAVAATGVALGTHLASTPRAVNSHPAKLGVVGACSTPLRTDPLPSWATTGFSDPTASGVPHAIGAQGKITAIMFGPLSYPESKTIANKVLWVTRVTAQPEPLIIDARLEGTGQTVQRQLPTGPGPSYLELPHAGCWQLSLTWDGGSQHDSLELPYDR